MTDAHNLQKSLEETKVAFQKSVEAHEVTSNEKLQLEAEVAKLKEALRDMEGRALDVEDVERMRVQEVKDMLAWDETAKADAEASLASFKTECENKIIREHEVGFMHAVRQTMYFCVIPPGFSFELSKDFYQGNIWTLLTYPRMLNRMRWHPPFNCRQGSGHHYEC
ncbi:uncharacterized protein LOC114915423 isoform X1 [Cajanus cajan]|uniref:uncharacterized protein LOC114915423 isoform X1 n=1 Tax=Cajanus cajan TaxID=3821 RepID=UPI0010FBA314|nr:uncharacterized protein LOC114915423 isoform X1 [Cajanus cajan]